MSNINKKWKLTDELRNEYKPVVEEFINKLESRVIDYDSDDEIEFLELDLSDTKLNPSTLEELLEELGYKKSDAWDNGWQWDFWATFTKSKCNNIRMSATGYTFTLSLSEIEE